MLSGGEFPALVMIESISRYLPEVLGSGLSAETDSFENGLLEAPQFTKPQSFNQLEVPATLLSGNHQKIAEWQKMVSILITLKKRPDLLLKQNIDWKLVQQFYLNLSTQDKSVMDISDLELPL